MAHAVTEVALLTFLPDADIESSLSTVEAISSRQEGIGERRWGRVGDDETTVQFLANWADISYHEQYIKILTPILAAPPVVFHVHLDQNVLHRVLDAPIVEVVTFYGTSEETQSIPGRVLGSSSAQGSHSTVVHGPVVEQLAKPGDNATTRAYFAMAGWDSRNNPGLLGTMEPVIVRNELGSATIQVRALLEDCRGLSDAGEVVIWCILSAGLDLFIFSLASAVLPGGNEVDLQQYMASTLRSLRTLNTSYQLHKLPRQLRLHHTIINAFLFAIRSRLQHGAAKVSRAEAEPLFANAVNPS
ncbi:hypothetical protein P170DRAFT_477606 [Aspergillus steynii IBT 23096]|uniref:ABM domain-containing protein n=1 Tax=Aspergillus steynii IBT 23096 TaxID=1392250 RepID=A0A2I2G1I0_9EURO|nr:uncharacterized protein P170DRAFT_477606 [Aspergillus steynii IBT 23096]PLB46735.1 hypothetical protein P170DRAFT_477606 [Aspergillus steynii IBT 23096]